MHFRRAAERLVVSTPTLSQQIKAVERELGGPLRVRGGGGSGALTAAGEVLLRTARVAVAAADEGVRQTRAAAGS